MSLIYVLRLSENKFYIGKTINLNRRFNEHLSGNAASWTKKFKPIEIIETYDNLNIFTEDSITKIYMQKYGIENVRGGSYCQIQIDNNFKKLLKREIYHATDKCLECGGNHFVKYCKVNKLNHKIDVDPLQNIASRNIMDKFKSHYISFNLYGQFLSIEEISLKRGISATTITAHIRKTILELINNNIILSYYELGINDEMYNQVLNGNLNNISKNNIAYCKLFTDKHIIKEINIIKEECNCIVSYLFQHNKDKCIFC